MRRVLAVAVLAIASCAAHAEGIVFVDDNGDGVRQDSERGVAGAVVAYEHEAFVVSDPDGHYELDVASDDGFVWVRVPDGFRPGPVWRRFGDTVDLPLVPLTEDEKASPFTIVMASDSHTTDRPDNPDDPWDAGDLGEAIEQATDLEHPPRFFTILGDITQGASSTSFDRVQAGLERTDVPFVPVPGNHDWYDGGGAYRDAFGIDGYSFDIQGVHFIVWNTNIPLADQVAFVAADLDHVDTAAMKVAALGHVSQPDNVTEQFAALGVDYVFTGHWHANRRADRFGMVEWSTQNFIMAGLDDTPAGYRIVTFTAGVPTMVSRERMVTPHLELAAPLPTTCASPTGFPIVAAASISAGTPRVRARIDCGTPFDLAPTGGWTYTGEAPALSPGTHSIDLLAQTPSGTAVVQQTAIAVCTDEAPAPSSWVTASWPQVGGGATHQNAVTEAIVPPLVTRWSTTIGGTPALGTPVVEDDTVVLSIVDRGSGDGGGVIALDLRTGALKWRVTTPSPVVNAPAIADGLVVIATNQGQILAVELATGAERWRVDLGDGVDGMENVLWGAPTIADGVVYTGTQGNFAALDLATGDMRWSHDPNPQYPWLGSRAAPAVSNDGTVVAPLQRTVGMFAWNAADGVQRWLSTGGVSSAINASPVVVDDTVYIINASSDLSALAVGNGAVRWSKRLNEAGFDWGYSATATPAYADGTLYVSTKFRDLIALDAETRIERWRATSPSSPVNFTHYRSNEPGFIGSPIVTGDLVWVGRPDGRLLALAAADGTEVWSTQLGAPIVTTPAPAGEVLVVATYDGVVRALTTGTEREPAAVAECDPWIDPPPPPEPDTGGGGCSSSTARPELVVLLLVLARVLRRRRALAA